MEKRIVVDDGNVYNIVRDEIKRLGNEADLNHIDVSGVTDVSHLFSYSYFNGDISKWDVSNVKSMYSMFSNSKFNQDISNWDVSNVVTMWIIFYKSQFNQDISKWNINLKKLKEKPDYFNKNNNKFIKSLFKAYVYKNKNDIDNLSRKVYINHIRKRLKI